MSNLLLQSCSASKNEVSDPTPALDVYSGYFYRIIKKAMREGEFRPDTEVTILSAKYGILAPTDEIEYYDRRMDTARARNLNQTVVDDATTRISAGKYDRLIVNMGSPYRQAISGLSERVDVSISEIQGDGIGEKGNALYRFIRGDDAAVTEVEGI